MSQIDPGPGDHQAELGCGPFGKLGCEVVVGAVEVATIARDELVDALRSVHRFAPHPNLVRYGCPGPVLAGPCQRVDDVGVGLRGGSSG
jgi:hypothetical protein